MAFNKNMKVHTAIFKADNQQGPTVGTGNAFQSVVAAWIGGESGRE